MGGGGGGGGTVRWVDVSSMTRVITEQSSKSPFKLYLFYNKTENKTNILQEIYNPPQWLLMEVELLYLHTVCNMYDKLSIM